MEKKVKVTPVYDKLANSRAKTVISVGGARSSKSYSIAQLLIQKLTNEKCIIGVTRKTFPALRMTTYLLIIDLLKEYGIYRESSHNKTEHLYRHNGSRLQFFSLDEPEKIKSLGANYIWMEEANEFTYEDYVILKLRLSEPTRTKNQIFLSFNPIDENNWIAKTLINEEDVEIIHSTYKDNPFLDEDYIKILQNLIKQDLNYYRIYALGEWGKLDNLIYKNYELIDSLPSEYQAMAYGLDFGFVNPVALVKVYLIDNNIYLEERLYRSHITNSELIELLSHEDRGDIYADRDELQRIEEISRAGYVCYPGEKDVKMGIDLCNRHKLYITKGSVNLIKEIRGYQRKVDKNGIVLEEAVKYNDHLMDATRFGVYGLVSRFGFATARPGDRLNVIHRFGELKNKIWRI